MVDYKDFAAIGSMSTELTGQKYGTMEQLLHYLTGVLHDDAIQLGCHIERLLRDTLVHVPRSALPYTSITEAANLANALVNCLRGIAVRLYKPSQEIVAMLPALQALLQDIAQDTNLYCTLTSDAYTLNQDLAYEKQKLLYEIVREAINNVVKHARATTLRITISNDTISLYVSVQDDGCGFVPLPMNTLLTAGRFGLMLLRERVHQLQGGLRIDTANGKGTVLTVQVPIDTNNG